MSDFLKKWRYQLMDRRMKVPGIYFLLVLVAPILWPLLVSGLLNFTMLFTIIGFVFLGLYLYVRTGQGFFGKRKKE